MPTSRWWMISKSTDETDWYLLVRTGVEPLSAQTGGRLTAEE